MDTMVLTSDEQKWALEELDNWLNIQLTKEQLDRVLKHSPDVIVQIKFDCDTVAREDLVRALANYLGLDQFPTYTTPDRERQKFWSEFFKRANLAGFLVGQEY
jgi:hypothetical protein